MTNRFLSSQKITVIQETVGLRNHEKPYVNSLINLSHSPLSDCSKPCIGYAVMTLNPKYLEIARQGSFSNIMTLWSLPREREHQEVCTLSTVSGLHNFAFINGRTLENGQSNEQRGVGLFLAWTMKKQVSEKVSYLSPPLLTDIFHPHATKKGLKDSRKSKLPREA